MKVFASLATAVVTVGAVALASSDAQAIAQGCPACSVSQAQPERTSAPGVKESSAETFKSEVLESTRPVLVDFYATWCGPCRKMAPLVEKISEQYGAKLAVFRIDIEKSPELAAEFGIRSIPAFRVFKNGKIAEEWQGLTPLSEMRKKIDGVL